MMTSYVLRLTAVPKSYMKWNPSSDFIWTPVYSSGVITKHVSVYTGFLISIHLHTVDHFYLETGVQIYVHAGFQLQFKIETGVRLSSGRLFAIWYVFGKWSAVFLDAGLHPIAGKVEDSSIQSTMGWKPKTKWVFYGQLFKEFEKLLFQLTKIASSTHRYS